MFKNCAPFTKCISKINNTQVVNAKYIDIVIPMYTLLKYSENYSKTSVNKNGDNVDFNGANATD